MSEQFTANQMLCTHCGDSLDLEEGDLKAGSFACPTCNQPLSLSDFYDFRLELATERIVKRHSRARLFLGIYMASVSVFSWFLISESADIPIVSWLTTLGGVALTTVTVIVTWALLNLPSPKFTDENHAELRSLATEKRNFERSRFRSRRKND